MITSASSSCFAFRLRRALLSAAVAAVMASGLAHAQTGSNALHWTLVAPGVWKSTIGQQEALTLLSAADIKPNLPALAELPNATFPLDTKKIESEQWEDKTSARFPLARDEEIYGLGVD